MRQIIQHNIFNGHYKAGAVVVWCFDKRFNRKDKGAKGEAAQRRLLERFLKSLNIGWPDIVSVAGGAKELASPKEPAFRRFLLWQIEASIVLHKTPIIILMTHTGCGAYGKKFRTHHAEHTFMRMNLKKRAAS